MGAQWKHKGRTEHAAAKGRLFTKLVKEIMVAAQGRRRRSGQQPPAAAWRWSGEEGLDAARHARARHQEGRGPARRAGELRGGDLRGLRARTRCRSSSSASPTTRTAPPPTSACCSARGSSAPAARCRGTSTAWASSRPRRPRRARTPRRPRSRRARRTSRPREEGATRFFTEPTDLDTVSRRPDGAGLDGELAEPGVDAPRTRCTLEGEAARPRSRRSSRRMDEDDDVQNIYVGLK